MAGIKPVPEGVGVAGLAPSFAGFGESTRRWWRGSRQPGVKLRGNVRDSCEHGW